MVQQQRYGASAPNGLVHFCVFNAIPLVHLVQINVKQVDATRVLGERAAEDSAHKLRGE